MENEIEIKRLNKILESRILNKTDPEEIIDIIKDIIRENDYTIISDYEADFNYCIIALIEHKSGLKLNCWLYSLESEFMVGFDDQIDLHDPESPNFFFDP